MSRNYAWLSVLLLPAAVFAQPRSPVPAPVKELECLVGSWKGAGSMEAEGSKANIKVDYKCRPAAGGWGVRCHLAMTGVPGVPVYELDDVWGYDAGDGSYHWFAVTNAGETHDHKGKIEGQTFKGQFVGTRDGKPFVETVEFRFANTKQVRVSWNATLGGKRIESGAVNLKKVGE